MAGSITSSGLISGIDTASIVDQLVALESRPITLLQKQQSGFKTQVSLLGDLISRLSALKTAASELGSGGVLAAKVASSNDAFTATPGSGALAGRYAVRVDQLAQASKWMSTGFASGTGMVAGTLQLTVKGTAYPSAAPITITDNMSLQDVAYAIRQSGAPVSATVLSGWDAAANGGLGQSVSYLSITARDTGFTQADGAGSALAIAFTPGTGTGQAPGFTETQAARNAAFNIDGVDFLRESNTVSDAIPGVTLALKKGAVAPTLGTTEDLVLSTDSDATKAKLQKFVEAYNGVMSLVQRQLAVNKDTDRSTTLAGDSSVRTLQARLQSILTHTVSGLPGVRTLADVGIKTGRDGSLSIDATTFSSALARDPAALDALFATPTSGTADFVSGLVSQLTNTTDGILTAHQNGLNARISAIEDQTAVMQRRIDAFKANLVKQFTAMETTLSNLKSTGAYLTQQLATKTSS
jgi:flagellar hook-associated protein 2